MTSLCESAEDILRTIRRLGHQLIEELERERQARQRCSETLDRVYRYASDTNNAALIHMLEDRGS
jgi:hypothetical protein